ncbi:MAG: carbon storage regulator [Candidatus Anammoximicrobium sp.]|nr:carbon storage regulator [Candidatus Anammoximicrobium sp.]
MLVLTRKLQETIHIGDNITITVVRIKGNTVRVGIEAPGDVRVVRGEVAARDEAETVGDHCTDDGTQAALPAAVQPRRELLSSDARVGSSTRRTRPTAPLARVAASRARLRLALADACPDAPAALRQTADAANPQPALIC